MANKRPNLKINMVNVIGRLTTTQIDLKEIFNNSVINDEIIGVEYNGKMKGNIEKKKSFANCSNMCIKYEDRIMKTKLFKSGTVHIPGCRSTKEGADIIKILNRNLKLPNSKPQLWLRKTMITAQFELNMGTIDRTIFASILRKKYKTYCTFIPNKYPGLKIKHIIPAKNKIDNERNYVTIIIHRSGKVGIKGANYEYKIKHAYDFIMDTVNKEKDNISILDNSEKVKNISENE